MRYTFTSLIKNNASGLLLFDNYIKVIVYPPAFLLAWVLLNFTRITANQLTLMGFTIGCLSAVASYFYGVPLLVFGFLLAFIVDFSDGIMARNGRSSGETGVLLDIIADRTLLFVIATMLGVYHVRHDQAVEILALLLYILLFIYEDIVAYAVRVAKNRYGKPFIEQGYDLPVLTFRNAFFKPRHFLPGRLSSPLFLILAGCISGHFVVAYGAGLLVLIIAYASRGGQSLVQQRDGHSRMDKE